MTTHTPHIAGPFFNRDRPEGYEPITPEEIFNIIRSVRDPEHMNMTLEDLRVVNLNDITVIDEQGLVRVIYTPTTPTCSLGSIIGLSLKIKLDRCLPRRFCSVVYCKDGTHENAISLNKQINDKERALAALTNKNIASVVNTAIRV